MIEQKLIVGRYIELDTPVPVDSGAAAPHGFRALNSIPLHINESSSSASPVQQPVVMPGFNPKITDQIKIAAHQAAAHVTAQFERQRVSTIGQNAVTKAHRNFVWLEWVPGKVSELQPGNTDVLTGPMSGCWITLYTRNGIRCVGHIGTEMDPATQNSIDAKNAWNAFAAGAPANSIRGFDPFNAWPGAFPAALPGESNLKAFALVTGTNDFYTVIAYPQLAKPKRIRIAGIQQRPSTLAANGQIP